jgi:UDP-N-acetylglucosamine pyrophosphorylase
VFLYNNQNTITKYISENNIGTTIPNFTKLIKLSESKVEIAPNETKTYQTPISLNPAYTK